MENKSTTSSKDIVPGQREGEILGAAIELIAVHGFHATSTRKIAKEAGVSESTIFYHFGSKEGLLLAILRQFYSELIDSARASLIDCQRTYDKLLCLALNHVRRISERNALMMRLKHANFIVDSQWHNVRKKSPIYELNKRYASLFDDVVLEGIENGELRPELKLQAFRVIFFGGLDYAMRTTLLHTDVFDDEDYIVKIVDGVWAAHSIESQPNKAGHTQADRMNVMFDRLDVATNRLEDIVEKA